MAFSFWCFFFLQNAVGVWYSGDERIPEDFVHAVSRSPKYPSLFPLPIPASSDRQNIRPVTLHGAACMQIVM